MSVGRIRRSGETMQPICAVCGSEFQLDVARRSTSWWNGIEGVRMLLCPDPACLREWERQASQERIR